MHIQLLGVSGAVAMTALLLTPMPASAQSCGTRPAWQVWELQNKARIVAGDRHLR